MTLGASIRIFLVDGSADGVWVVEKSNWTGKALAAPRTRYKELRARTDLDGPGVYVLVGPSESGVPPLRIYIGETDDLPGRLDSHNSRKDFWNRVIVFTSKDANLNKAHIRYLEARLIGLASSAKRSELENGNAGQPPPLSEADRADAEAFLAEMLLLYPVLGVSVFQSAEDQAALATKYLLKGPDASAQGAETPDGFIVYAGSRARRAETPSIHAYISQMRATFVERGVFQPDGDQYLMPNDYLFPSPSQAAMVLLGRTANGRDLWRTAEGVSLKEIQTAGTTVREGEE